MGNKFTIGKYLDRTLDVIYLVQKEDLLEYSDVIGISTTVLIASKDVEQFYDFRNFWEVLVRCAPMAISVGGGNASDLYNQLLEVLSMPESPNDIVSTYFEDADIDGCIASFLFSLFPIESRFQEWKSHLILVFNYELVEEIKEIVARNQWTER